MMILKRNGVDFGVNNLFRIKRNAHRLVNYSFYFIFFAAGYVLGGGAIEKMFENIVNYIKYLFNF